MSVFFGNMKYEIIEVAEDLEKKIMLKSLQIN